eukprot:10388650-Heterocapsa_arctica.AAC.1
MPDIQPAEDFHLGWRIYDRNKHVLSYRIADPYYCPQASSGKSDWMSYPRALSKLLRHTGQGIPCSPP